MSAGARFVYHFGRRSQSAQSAVDQLNDSDLRAAEKAMYQLRMHAGGGAPWADDLLRIARAVYLADKRSARDVADDGWTRTIFLKVQVVDPELWRPRTMEVNRLLALLTGDRWQVEYVAGAVRYAPMDSPLFTRGVGEVALFSGGLDSTAYAASRMRGGPGPLVLVSYHEPDDLAYQRRLVRILEALGDRPVELNEVPLQAFSVPGKSLELSTRSRGLLFAATALYVASGLHATTVAVPENGQLAINPPLTPARPAACSTRSVHPATLEALNRLVTNVGGDIELINPFAGLTKGEVCKRALQAGLPEDALWTTVSCGRPPVKRRPGGFHCGRCFPCLVRRAGLIIATGGDETDYEHELGPTGNDGKWPDDLYALCWWLTHRFSASELLGDVALPASADMSAVMDVLLRGRAELIEMLRHNIPLDELPPPLRPHL